MVTSWSHEQLAASEGVLRYSLHHHMTSEKPLATLYGRTKNCRSLCWWGSERTQRMCSQHGNCFRIAELSSHHPLTSNVSEANIQPDLNDMQRQPILPSEFCRFSTYISVRSQRLLNDIIGLAEIFHEYQKVQCDPQTSWVLYLAVTGLRMAACKTPLCHFLHYSASSLSKCISIVLAWATSWSDTARTIEVIPFRSVCLSSPPFISSPNNFRGIKVYRRTPFYANVSHLAMWFVDGHKNVMSHPWTPYR